MKNHFVPNFGLIVTIYQKNKGNMHHKLKRADQIARPFGEHAVSVIATFL